MTICDATISDIVHGRDTPDDSTSVTNSTDAGSDTSTALSLDRTGNSASYHGIRGNIRRSPRSLNPKNRIINMDTRKYDKDVYSSPHIHLDETTIALIGKKDGLITEVEKSADEKDCLEDQIVAVALVNSVVENTDIHKVIPVISELRLSADGTGTDVDSRTGTESRVGVTLNCENIPLAESENTNYMEFDENKSCMEAPHVVENNVQSSETGEKDDQIYTGAGVYCGTRKRKRDALHPDSPCSIDEATCTTEFQAESKPCSPSGGVVRSRVWKENYNSVVITKSVVPSIIKSSTSSLRAILGNSQKSPYVANSSVPNPILGSPFKIETDSEMGGLETNNVSGQISKPTMTEALSIGNTVVDQVKTGIFRSGNSINLPHETLGNTSASVVPNEPISSQYPLESVPPAPKCASLPEPCPVKREEHLVETTPTNDSGERSLTLPNHGSDNEYNLTLPRRRIFSIDLDPDVFDFGTCLGTSTPSNEFETSSAYDVNKSLSHLGDKLDPNSIINRVSYGSEKYNYVADENSDRIHRETSRDRGMSFELFSFGLAADEPLPPTQAAHYGEVAPGRVIGGSNIFDPVSFTDGGIHEETALSRSRPYSIILEENDEIELMNTPGFVEGPAPHCQLQTGITQSVPNPVSSQSLFPHLDDNMLPSRISESSSIGNINNVQYCQDASNAELPISAYSSMAVHNITNTEDDFLVSQDNAAAASLLSQVLPITIHGTVSHTSCPMELLNKGGRIGIYLPVARKERIAKFHSKRKMRIWRKRIKYDCRKKLADSRPRIKGRFVKSLEQDE